MVTEKRRAVVEDVERAGIVAIIRMKDPDKLRAVVDAIAEGGVRAIEVTMTVPGAVELIAQLAPTLPPGFLLGAGTVIDADTARARRSTPARSSSSARCSGARSSTPATSSDVAVMPGCFTPTEILDAWDAGADIVQGVSGDGARPAVHQGRARARCRR